LDHIHASWKFANNVYAHSVYAISRVTITQGDRSVSPATFASAATECIVGVKKLMSRVCLPMSGFTPPGDNDTGAVGRAFVFMLHGGR
jgi:hypothetical protein